MSNTKKLIKSALESMSAGNISVLKDNITKVIHQKIKQKLNLKEKELAKSILNSSDEGKGSK